MKFTGFSKKDPEGMFGDLFTNKKSKSQYAGRDTIIPADSKLAELVELAQETADALLEKAQEAGRDGDRRVELMGHVSSRLMHNLALGILEHIQSQIDPSLALKLAKETAKRTTRYTDEIMEEIERVTGVTL